VRYILGDFRDVMVQVERLMDVGGEAYSVVAEARSAGEDTGDAGVGIRR